MTAQLFNNISDVLLNPVASSDTEIQIQSGNVPSISPGDYTPIYVIRSNGSFEIMHVTAVSGTTLTVLRAQEGTDPLVFESGVSVQIRPTRQSLLEMNPGTGDVTTSIGTQTLAEAIDSRVVRVDSIAALLALDTTNLSSGDQVNVLGYHSGSDVGGGIFYWDDDRPKSEHDGGSIIDPDKTFPADWTATAVAVSWFSPGSVGQGCWVRGGKAVYSAHDFGCVGEGSYVERPAFAAALAFAGDGRWVDFGSGTTYDLGAIAADEKWCVHIDSPRNMRVTGKGVLVKATTDKTKDSAIAIKNPFSIEIDGLEFTNPGFDIATTVGGGENRIGIYGIYLYATAPYTPDSPCGHVKISGTARDCIGFVTCTTESVMGGVGAVQDALVDVEINGEITRVYYGVTTVGAAHDLRCNILFEDVRRGVYMYDQRRAQIDASLKCTPDFAGSNAFIGMVCSGEAIAGPTEDIDIRLRVSGVEAHDVLVHFYHQQDEPEGVISNVKSRVTCDNLTTVGKSSLMGDLIVYRFSHVDISGATISPTTRETSNFDLECDILGSISGRAVQIVSVPDTKWPGKIGPNAFATEPSFGLWQFFTITQGRQSGEFLPAVIGDSVAGAGTYTVQQGRVTVVDGVAHFSLDVAWSSHTGSGTVRITGLPVIASLSSELPQPVVSLGLINIPQASSNVHARITTPGTRITPYLLSEGAGSLSFVPLPNAGQIPASGSFDLY